MILSRFLFRRGDKTFEVLVQKKWNRDDVESAVQKEKKATPLFLEEDDLISGNDVFALDIFLMQQNGMHLGGKNMLNLLEVDKEQLKKNIESEIRRLATKLRTAYHFREILPMKAVLVTLEGIADGLEEFGYENALPETVRKELLSFAHILSPQKKNDILLVLLQDWENFLENNQ